MTLEKFKWHYMSLSGRIGRKNFWLYYVLPAFLIGIALEFVGTFHGSDKQLILTIMLIPVLCMLMCGYVKRQHDLGRSGLWVILSAIPLIGFFYNIFYLGCFKGDEGENKYGESVVTPKEMIDA